MFRGARQVTIGQGTIGAGYPCECLDRKTRVKGKCLQIGVFIDDTRSDQHLIRPDTDVPGPCRGRAQQSGSENLPQAIQFARRAWLWVVQPIVVARLQDMKNVGGKRRRLLDGWRRRRSIAKWSGSPSANPNMVLQRQVTPLRNKRYSRLVPDGL